MSKKTLTSGKKEDKKQKTPATPKPAPKSPAGAPTENKPEPPTKAQVVTMVSTKPEKLLERAATGKGALSADAKVQLLDLTRRTFVEETRPHLVFPKETQTSVNRIVAAGILCTIADHVLDGDDSFAQVMQAQGYPALVKAAEDLGFKLPDIKALPVKEDTNQVVLPASEVKISPEAKEKLKEEKKIREGEKPELDPTKISSEEEVKKALEYMFASTAGKRMPNMLTEAIDFMKKFREHEAELAENTEEAKAKFANYNAGDWLDDVFGYFRPTVFFNGIGRGMATVTDAEQSPIHAFTIFRDAIKDKKTGEPVMDDQSIAYCVKSIVKWVCNTNIDSNKKAIENLDKEKNKTEIEKCEAQIQKYNNILANITSPSSEEVDNLLTNMGTEFDSGGQLTPECQRANATFNRICKTYYGKQLSDADYKNLSENVRQYAGCILNYFLDAGSQLASYKLANITELEERSEEERETMIKEAKKAWAEKKTAKKEEEIKNA